MRNISGGIFGKYNGKYHVDLRNKTNYMYIATTISEMDLPFGLNISYNYPDDTVEVLIYSNTPAFDYHTHNRLIIENVNIFSDEDRKND